MLMPSGIGTSSVPLGPCTLKLSPIWILTAGGRGISFFPTLDMSLSLYPLPNAAEDFAAHAFFARGFAGHDAAGSGQDADSEASLDAGNICLANIIPAAGARDALDTGYHGRIVGSVLQIDLNDFLHAFFGHFEVGDVALLFEDAGNLGLELRRRHVHFGVARRHGVAHPGQHICNRITSHMDGYPPSTSWTLQRPESRH